MLKSEYLQRVYTQVITRDPDQREFHQAVLEVLESLDLIVDKHPEYEAHGIIETFVEPERMICFRVPWDDDQGRVHVNRGYRIQFSSAIGPYKGGLRFHPTVNLSILKFLGFEQILKNSLTGLLTGKGLSFGGSLVRTEATGYGLCYLTEEMLKCMKQESFAGKTVVISGSGNVAIFATEKAAQRGGMVGALSDSNGYIHDPNGIDLDVVKDIKLGHRGRIKEYVDRVPGSTYTEGFRGIWSVPCDIALPCATQNEIDGEIAKTIVKNGAIAVAEGANMPCLPEAIRVFQEAGVLFAPAKAANAGGVATSGLEMSQNSMRYSWSFEEVDRRLKDIMVNIFHNAYNASQECGVPGDLVVGANIAGFLKVSQVMVAQGLI